MATHNLQLTDEELVALRELLIDTAATMDDDGNEGEFEASHLRPIYDKVRKLQGEKPSREWR